MEDPYVLNIDDSIFHWRDVEMLQTLEKTKQA